MLYLCDVELTFLVSEPSDDEDEVSETSDDEDEVSEPSDDEVSESKNKIKMIF